MIMPLVRYNVTKASEIMLPLYPISVIPIGLAFIFQDESRTISPTYDAARALLPLSWWGVLFVLVGLIEIAAMVLGNVDAYLLRRDTHRSRWLYERALIVGAGLCAFWMILILSAAFQSDRVSFTAGWWLLLAVGAHIASARSLGQGEV